MPSGSPLLEHLNPIQAEAVLHTEGPLLIVAGAGSGKTRALTHRIAYLIREQGVNPFGVLAITFTNKAAREMAERVEDLLGGRVAKGMWILTFHSACARILRREHAHLELPTSFTIYDEGDTERLIAAVLRDLNLDDKRYPPRAMAAAIGKAKDHVLSADEFAGAAGNLYEQTIAQVYQAYEKRKRAAGALDFDDLHLRDRPPVPRAPRGARALPGALPLHPDRRVPGHEPGAVPAGQPPGREVPERLRRRRRRPGRLLLARGRRSRTCWTSSATTPTPRSS